MFSMKKTSKEKLISAAAAFISAAVLLSGSGMRMRTLAQYAEDAYDIGSRTDYGQRSVVGSVPVTAGTNADVAGTMSRRSIAVYIDGVRYPGDAFLYKETTYVGLREFAKTIAGAAVSWNGSTNTATAKTSSVTVTATKGKEYISANGRYLWTKTGIIIRNDIMYVPVRALCIAFGAALTWNGTSYTVNINKGSGTIRSGASFYDSDEVYWLSKIIHAESRGEPLTGKIAVGNVVLNRVRSKDYPNTIYGVIFDKKYGVQFSPVADGSINLEPDTESIIAAKLCLEGYTVSTSILFFINKNIADNMWVTNTRPLAVSIGKHDFYA
ncbi:MAG: copper amine oxidase [Ruminococcaceae bacterium]|nr:copper amine oxidase [Oscillospiraceae bacterium]